MGTRRGQHRLQHACYCAEPLWTPLPLQIKPAKGKLPLLASVRWCISEASERSVLGPGFYSTHLVQLNDVLDSLQSCNLANHQDTLVHFDVHSR